MTQEVENWSYTDRNVRIRIPVVLGYRLPTSQLAQKLMLRGGGARARACSTVRSPTSG